MRDHQEELTQVLYTHIQDSTFPGSPPDQIVVVWFSKTLQNAKMLAIVDLSGRYYEVTYNGETNEYYIDQYEKVNSTVTVVPRTSDQAIEDLREKLRSR